MKASTAEYNMAICVYEFITGLHCCCRNNNGMKKNVALMKTAYTTTYRRLESGSRLAERRETSPDHDVSHRFVGRNGGPLSGGKEKTSAVMSVFQV